MKFNLLVVLLVVGIVLIAGCTSQTQTQQQSPPAQTNQGTQTQVKQNATQPAMQQLTFDGSVKVDGNTATLTLQPNYKVVAPGANKDGEGHFHLFLDGGSYIPVADVSYTFTNLSAGQHNVRVTANYNDHTPAGFEKTFNFTVGLWFNASALVEGSTVVLTMWPNYQVVAPGANKDGEGHFHLFLDGGSYIPVANVAYKFVNLTSGEHSVRITANNNDHSEAGYQTTLNFTVPDFSASIIVNSDNSATVTLKPINFQVVPPSDTLVSNQGHFHFFVDGGSYIPVASTTYTIANLTAGQHSVRITLNNNDHSETGITHTYNFTVQGSSTSGSGQSQSGGSSGGSSGGYYY